MPAFTRKSPETNRIGDEVMVMVVSLEGSVIIRLTVSPPPLRRPGRPAWIAERAG